MLGIVATVYGFLVRVLVLIGALLVVVVFMIAGELLIRSQVLVRVLGIVAAVG